MVHNKVLSRLYNALMALFVGSLLALAPAMVAEAAVNPTPAARISFTFDDGLTSSLTQAAPVLQKYNIPGTNYVTTNCVGSRNTCRADKTASYMTWSQVKTLQNTYGWEIGSHTQNHYPLTTRTKAQKETELSASKQAFTAQGINATSFASPEGDYDQETLELVAKYYSSHRGFHDTGMNTWPYSDYLIRVQQVQTGISVAQVKAAIDQAIANDQWIVLVFHDIKVNASTNPIDYEYSTANLNEIASYVGAKQTAGKIKATKVKDGLVTNSTSMLANGSFTTGINNGWTTDTPQTVVSDSASNGSSPEATRSVKITSGGTNSHLFSPKVTTDPYTTYIFKNYLTVKQITTGEVGFYIDEYDVNGNWVSGQWKGAEKNKFAQNYNFSYRPSSPLVASTSLQIYATGGSAATAYVDNVKLFTLSTVQPPVQTDLLTNGDFDEDLTVGWTTDALDRVTRDTGNNGSAASPANAVKMSLNGSNAHLFSNKVAVTSGTSYRLSSFTNVTTLSVGEVGFYIDEYDANGNWVSGQWKTGKWATGSSTVVINYTPTSAAVATASLQIYGSGTLEAFFDDISWVKL